MNEKINQLLEQYKENLDRKLRLLQPYIDKKNDDDLFEPKWNIIDQENYSRLKAETEMLKRHIDDLEWILSSDMTINLEENNTVKQRLKNIAEINSNMNKIINESK